MIRTVLEEIRKIKDFNTIIYLCHLKNTPAAKDEIKTDAAIIGDSIHHISISPEEYHKITRQLNFNQSSQFTNMELVKRQLQTKRQGE